MASKLGEEYKEGKNKKRRLLKDDIDLIVNTFKNKEAVEDFSVAVSYDEIKEKGYSLSAGQYFDIKIDYVDITEEEFNNRMPDSISTSRLIMWTLLKKSSITAWQIIRLNCHGNLLRAIVWRRR